MAPPRWLAQALAGEPPEPPWLWDGYVARGALTLLAGRPKVGKSTAVFGLLSTVTAGEPFMGRATTATGALLLSEERGSTLEEKRRRWCLDERVHLLMKHQTGGETWMEVVDQAARYCLTHDLGLLAVDVWDKWSGLKGDAENNPGATIEALEPLMKVAGDGLAVLIVTHQRKAEGAHGEAIRGSNALAGGVDVLIELERIRGDAGSHPSARVLLSESRYSGTPNELAVQLTDDGFEPCGDLAAIRDEAELDRFRQVGSESEGDALGAAGWAERTGVSESTARRRLKQLEEAGECVPSGEGVKGDPKRWSFPSTTLETLVVERNDDGEPFAATNGPRLEIVWDLRERALPPLATADEEAEAARIKAKFGDVG